MWNRYWSRLWFFEVSSMQGAGLWMNLPQLYYHTKNEPNGLNVIGLPFHCFIYTLTLHCFTNNLPFLPFWKKPKWWVVVLQPDFICISAATQSFCHITFVHSKVPEGNNTLESKIIKHLPGVFVFNRLELKCSSKAEEGEEGEEGEA